MQCIGLEISASGSSALVLDLDSGHIQTQAWQAHSWVENLPPGYREQDPTCWIEAAAKVIAECLSHEAVQAKEIAAIGIAGPMRGQVLLDAHNRIIRPAKMVGDTSILRQIDELGRHFGGTPGLLELMGQHPLADSAAAEILWLKTHEPYHFQRATLCLSPQDFLAYWLTGEVATEAATAAVSGLFDIRQRQWCQEIIEWIDPKLAHLLPPVGAPTQSRGVLRAELARLWGLSEQTQVSPGGPAAALTVLAAGAVAGGDCALEMGQTVSLAAVGERPVIDLRNEIVPLCASTGQWLGLASSSSAISSLEILKRHYGWSHHELEMAAATVAPGADGLLMLPYFSGEAIPRLPEACGVLHGMTAHNFTPAHLARAAMEGVALTMAYAMSRLRELGFQPPGVRLSGPGAASPLMCQLLANCLGTPIATFGNLPTPAFGAAVQAAVCFFQHCGESLGFEEITSYLVSSAETGVVVPDPSTHNLYLDLMARQQYLADTLHPAGFL